MNVRYYITIKNLAHLKRSVAIVERAGYRLLKTEAGPINPVEEFNDGRAERLDVWDDGEITFSSGGSYDGKPYPYWNEFYRKTKNN